MSIRTLRQAALIPLALLCLACNPFAVQMPEQEGGPRQRPAASVDLPPTEPGSAQVSLADSLATACAPGPSRGHGNRADRF